MVELNLKSFKRLLRFLYLKLIKINDTPQRVALGLALGVFLGLIPGTGSIAAITLAIVFRLNRFAAITGSLITNTWLSLAMLIPAIKTGAKILNLNWTELNSNFMAFLAEFRWSVLFKVSIYKIILPVAVGYVTISLSLAVLVYVISISIILHKRHGTKDRSNVS